MIVDKNTDVKNYPYVHQWKPTLAKSWWKIQNSLIYKSWKKINKKTLGPWNFKIDRSGITTNYIKSTEWWITNIKVCMCDVIRMADMFDYTFCEYTVSLNRTIVFVDVFKNSIICSQHRHVKCLRWPKQRICSKIHFFSFSVVPAGIVGISAIVTKLEGYGNHQLYVVAMLQLIISYKVTQRN